MAIQALAQASLGVPKMPKSKPIDLSTVPGIGVGYSGSGWNYPLSSVGNMPVHYATTPNTPPTFVAPSGGGGGGFSQVPALQTPNTGPPNVDASQYLKQLTGDPLYQSGLQSYNDQVAANRLALGAALKQSVIQGGWGGGGGPGQVNLSNVGGQNFSDLVDQTSWDAAAANQMSDRAQLQRQLTQGLAGVAPQLAARGAARSGAANIASANVQNQYDVAANQALQNLSGSIGSNVNQWAANNQYALANWNAAQGNIANRLAQMANAYSQPAVTSGTPNTTPLGNGAQVTTQQSGPSPKTLSQIGAVKSAVKSGKKIGSFTMPSMVGYGAGPGGGWGYPGG